MGIGARTHDSRVTIVVCGQICLSLLSSQEILTLQVGIGARTHDGGVTNVVCGQKSEKNFFS